MANARKPFIPPGGIAGFSEMTPAVKALLGGRTARPRRKTTRKKRTTKKKATRRKTGTRRKKTGALKKGSAAAKRRMAQLRKMRGKGRRKK